MTDQELIEAVAVEVMEAKIGYTKDCLVYGLKIGNGSNHYFDGATAMAWNPLINANHWMMVIERMRDRGLSKTGGYDGVISFRKGNSDYRVSYFNAQQTSVHDYFACHKSLGHAVCLAALKTVRSMKGGDAMT